MITFTKLGSYGRLGNQMFQYASLRGIAHNNQYHWGIPRPDNTGLCDYTLFDCFEMGTVKEENFINLENIKQITSISKAGYEFNIKLYNNCVDNTDLQDYLQSYKYFENILDVIKLDFTFRDHILESCRQEINLYNDPIFLHVRRGDYLNQPQNHPTCSVEYYSEALKLFPDSCDVLVFSDDLDWCKENFKSNRYIIQQENIKHKHQAQIPGGLTNSFVPYYDLCKMSLCGGGIISNSSLSWWGAYLGPRKYHIVYPHPWFGPALSHNTKDLIPLEWVKLNIKTGVLL